MDKSGFEEYLKKGGRSPNAVLRCVKYVSAYEDFVTGPDIATTLDHAQPGDLIKFINELEEKEDSNAKGYLWAIRYYYDFIDNPDIKNLAGVLREERIERKPFSVKNFRGVDKRDIEILAEFGINNIDQLLRACLTREKREELAEKTGIPISRILELTKLSDMARIPGVKGIRARLYYDAGIDTVEKIASLEPEALRANVVEFVQISDFDGVPTLPAEAVYTVEKARQLPKIVQY
jgi:hypothetical protein